MQQPAQIQSFPLNVTGREYFSEPCHKYLIHYLGNSTSMPTFCRFLLEKLKFYYAGGGKCFEKISGGYLFGTGE